MSDKIVVTDRYNYVAFFLTFRCNLKCSYCINLHDNINRANQVRDNILSGDEWVKIANRFVLRDDLPISLQGGEPTLHPDFFKIVNDVRDDIKMDLLTNMQFDAREFVKNVPVSRFTRNAPYASIRVSYHPHQNSIDDIIEKTHILEDAGFRVGVYMVEVPDMQYREHLKEVKDLCKEEKIDFRTKEFLGVWNGKLYGTIKYNDSTIGETIGSCNCRTTEILIDPRGSVYRCHSDLYHKRESIASILDDSFNLKMLEEFRNCEYYGICNPCDVKVKTNRFQIYGHTSVEIKDIKIYERLQY